MFIEYVALKQFALNDEIYNEGDVMEIDEKDAKNLVENGKIKVNTEEKSLEVNVDTKGISEAIEKGFMRFAPKPVETEKKMGFGKFLQGIATKTINISTSTQGGYTATEYVDPNIDTDLLKSSRLSSLVTEIALSGTNNIYKMNVIDSSVSPAVVVESATFGNSQPTVTQFSFTLVKIGTSYVASEESLEDTGALIQEINASVPDQFAQFLEDGILNGNDAMDGVIDNTNTHIVTPQSGETTATISIEDIDSMVVSAKNLSRCVWVVSRSCYLKLLSLDDAAGNRIWMGPNGVSDAPSGTIYGLPVIVSDYCAALGEKGDIVLGDFSKYRMVTKGGLKMAQSAEVAFLEDNMTFKFRYRVAGKQTNLKFQATDGTYIADFVVLETRDESTQSSSSS